MIKYVFFDWNGTLLADTALRFKLTNESMKFMDQTPLSLGYYQKYHFVPVRQFYRKIGVPEKVLSEKDEAARIKWHDAYEIAIRKAHTRRGARSTLEALHERHITRIILSNHTISGINEQLERLHLSHHFDEILANDNIHTAASQGKKELLAGYLLSHEIKPDTAAIIGDTVEEIIIGKHFGLKTIALTGGTHTKSRLKAEKPDVLISSLHDLIKVMEDL